MTYNVPSGTLNQPNNTIQYLKINDAKFLQPVTNQDITDGTQDFLHMLIGS